MSNGYEYRTFIIDKRNQKVINECIKHSRFLGTYHENVAYEAQIWRAVNKEKFTIEKIGYFETTNFVGISYTVNDDGKLAYCKYTKVQSEYLQKIRDYLDR